jgi:hypothetical protein
MEALSPEQHKILLDSILKEAILTEPLVERAEKTMAIEVSENEKCRNLQLSNHCGQRNRPPHNTLKVCQKCPIWTPTDVLYEDITGRQIEQTYAWWRKEWEEHALPYALERMQSHVKESTRTPTEQAALEASWEVPRRHALEAASSLVSSSKVKAYWLPLGVGTVLGILVTLFVLQVLAFVLFPR